MTVGTPANLHTGIDSGGSVTNFTSPTLNVATAGMGADGVVLIHLFGQDTSAPYPTGISSPAGLGLTWRVLFSIQTSGATRWFDALIIGTKQSGDTGPTNGTFTCTITSSSTTRLGFEAALILSGANVATVNSWVTDDDQAASGGGATPTLGSANATDLLFTTVGHRENEAITLEAGWTELSEFTNASPSYRMSMGYQAGNADLSAGWTWATANTYAGWVVAIPSSASTVSTGARLRITGRVKVSEASARAGIVRMRIPGRQRVAEASARTASAERLRAAVRARAGDATARSGSTAFRASLRLRDTTVKGALASPRLRVPVRARAAATMAHSAGARLRSAARPSASTVAAHTAASRLTATVRVRVALAAAHATVSGLRAHVRPRNTSTTDRQPWAILPVTRRLAAAATGTRSVATRLGVSFVGRVATGSQVLATTAARIRVAVRTRASVSKGAPTATRLPASPRPRATTAAGHQASARVPVGASPHARTAASHQATARISAIPKIAAAITTSPGHLVHAVLRLIARWRSGGQPGAMVNLPGNTDVVFYADGRTSVTSLADGRTDLIVAADGRTSTVEVP